MIVDKLVRGVGQKVGVALLLRKVRAAAEGRLGPVWKARYWAMAGKKTWTALALTVTAGVAAYLGHDQVAVGVATLAGLLMQAGLLDKAWRGQLPAELAQSQPYRFLAQHSADLATLSGVAASYFTTCGHDCDAYAWGLALVTALLAELGLLDAAARAKPPSGPPAPPMLDRAA